MADDKKKGGKFPESLIAILIIIIVMYMIVGGGLTGGGSGHGSGEVLSGDGVTRAVPASGNLTPQPDYHLNDR